jgi:glycosyltransferase involved in cell wall biosynthesis
MKVSCLIPCFNERERIAAVLDVVTRSAYIAQVVCVDDGSEDGTADFIALHWPEVEVVRLVQNIGKTAAHCTGLKWKWFALFRILVKQLL